MNSDPKKINAEIKDGENYLRGMMGRLLELNADAEVLQYTSQAIATLSYALLVDSRFAAVAGTGGMAAVGLASRIRGLRPLGEQSEEDTAIIDKT